MSGHYEQNTKSTGNHQKMDFTDKTLATLPNPEKPVIFRTKDESGIFLRVTPTGRKSWVVRWRFLGEIRRTTLGAWPEMDLDLAQRAAHMLISRHDPKTRKHPSLWAIADAYTNAKDTTSAINHLAGVRRHILPLLPPIIEDLTASHIVQACDDIILTTKLKPSTLSGLINFLARAYRYCEARDESLPPSPFDRFAKIQKTAEPDTKPIPDTEKIRKNLNDSELAALLSSFPTPQSPLSGIKLERSRFIRFLLLTGLRRDEARLLRHSEVHLDAEIPHLTFQAERKKAGREHKVALSSSALNLIGQAPAGQPHAFVFPLLAKQSSTAITKFMSRAGANPHRIRFTLANRLATRLDCPGEVVARILSHSTKADCPGVTAYYMDADYDHQLSAQLPWLERAATHFGL